MMRKILFIIITCITIQSCTVVQVISTIPTVSKIQKIKKNQKELFKNNSQQFVYKNNRILLPTIINGQVDTLLFDSGYSGDFFQIENNIKPIKDSCVKLRVSSHYVKEKLYVKLLSINIENDLMKWNNHIGMEIYTNKPCSNKQYCTLGVSVLDTVIMLLNFDDKKISIFEDACIKKDDYFEVKSSFKYNVISLFLTVDATEYKFIFDTGSPINLLNIKDYKHKENSDIVYEGHLLEDISGVKFDQTNIVSKPIFHMNKNYCLESKSIYLPDINDNIIGMSFISKFNWIIDYKNKKVYVKPRKSTEEIEYKNKTLYATMILKDKLIISTRNKTANPPYKLKSVIKSVNGELINNDNRCYYMNLLNTTSDWSKLNVEIE